MINPTNKFFRTRIRKNFSLIVTKHNLIFSLGILLFISCAKNENLHVRTFKTNNGWGYTITNNEKIIIKQNIIPVISKNKSFKTEKEALRVGQLVLQKLTDDLSPTVTKKDLILLDINI